jgi:hypothetical protein
MAQGTATDRMPTIVPHARRYPSAAKATENVKIGLDFKSSPLSPRSGEKELAERTALEPATPGVTGRF